ncbi:YdeI/OmpD-associated family protein [Microbacterium sp. ANT_H45B]|uniref:YdeI/OmpD-associated family protein n=1 Tax=Microbacterium sp. ANT_H45B TaxID=2597346 RepID=UPI0021CD4379|nr:YdeI/OmpD-associated family protein [Microbacterium sp. ANT_H45B]
MLEQPSARERTKSPRFHRSRVGGHKRWRPTKAYDPVAQAFASQSAQNRFSTAFRVTNLKRSASRAARVAEYVAMLNRGETLH